MTTDTSATRNRAGTAAGPAPGPAMGDPRRFNVRAWLLSTAAFVSFPIAGIAAQAAAGRINDATAALAGGLVAGAWAAGYGTSAGELAVMGAITGLPLGAAQAFRSAAGWPAPGCGRRPSRCCGRWAGPSPTPPA